MNATATTTATTPAAPITRDHSDADGMAVASFILGLIGLLLFNLVFGPCAIILGGLALVKGTHRRGRALLGIALGVADLVVLAALVTLDNSVIWQFGG
ncbi:DUF4190 domain-containing protein [Streptomyces palmae]|uniref:DUF4190 domain-containing protein n=1 Tax=Streptomyces palmae TaxID=1701085 RepID=A0A4Z0GMY0_9ACTN|nr:DUF4190 domain-containing protein [Streptomyces palmae]TGA97905.1 DUF4190 domain-containing protein [Streptomyces palmae]